MNNECIECPEGCALEISARNGKITEVKGGKCPKGETYAVSEVENPLRILTSTVLARGLSLILVPVRTNKPIPKSRMFDAVKETRKIRLDKPVSCGAIIIKNFLELGVDLIATRETVLNPKTILTGSPE